ncbi:hypothetical protein H2201_004409 [Coniosporium apollinis]|uniref:alkaline phosphatase n=1 Tax=Coniosporium apollinis TaxID=61459 RepID=A0ABQ9NZH3_9PEZI|nr:hypothetical protein H2201_004409 [Coniosporium apollinis]
MLFGRRSAIVAAAAALALNVSAQTFQRLGGCPTLGCIFPPDQADFLAGQYFDIRLEVHAPVNGSEATGRQPDPNFTFTIARANSSAQSATQYFGLEEPRLERWNFTWFEDLFARDARRPSVVNVTAKAYRRVALYEPGEYTATLNYNNGSKTVATWTVRDIAEERKTKNIILFIGDGMTTNMITAARLIAHRSVNGKYKTRMAMDQFPVLGHQMTHSLDSFMTDSANSAMSIYTGHKSMVNCLGVYADSSRSPFDDPKVESIAEIFYRLYEGNIGIVSTAFIADATPGALTAHTRDRSQYPAVVDSFLNGITNYTWTNWTGPDVLFGGGAEQFYRGGRTYMGRDYYEEFANAGYNVVLNNTALLETANDTKTLGIFSVSNMAKWLDRNVYTDNLLNQSSSPDGSEGDALDQPGLKEMTLKAIDILETRSAGEGYFLMSEAASIDKMMHALDYDRALGELLELDDTIKATIERLTEMDTLNDTLILVTADHGHGFDVMGSVDTLYFNAQENDRARRNAIGVYQNSGQSQYVIGNLTYSEGVHFPATWEPRYSLYEGVTANPDRNENYQVNKEGVREPAVNITARADFYANPADDIPDGILVNGTLPVDQAQGVHSLTDVPVFAKGPCQELFGGVYNNIDLFYGMAECLGLSRRTAPHESKKH